MVADPVSKMLFAGDEILADISKQDGYSVELIPQEI
jgi:hypothetical protein